MGQTDNMGNPLYTGIRKGCNCLTDEDSDRKSREQGLEMLGELRRSGLLGVDIPSNGGDSDGKATRRTCHDSAFSPVGRKASDCVSDHIYANWLQRRHIAQTASQCPDWCCYADRKKKEKRNRMLILPGFSEPRKSLPRIQHNAPTTAGVGHSLVECLAQLTCCSRGCGASQSGSLLSWHLHPNNNYMIKRTKMKWNLINTGSSGTRWRLTNR